MNNILNFALSYPLNSYILALKEAKNRVKPALNRRGITVSVLMTGVLFGFLPLFHFVNKAQADIDSAIKAEQIMMELSARLGLLQGNSLLPFSSPAGPDLTVVRKLNVVITAYSSSVWQTDDTPNITASGKWVKDGIVANNLLPFGTKIRIPELYGDRVFIVEDRMSYIKGNYHVDIWFSSYWEAVNFGAKRTHIEVLGS
jgi:3D (Asp-Asp-Asp) domain-containing protein